MTSLLYLSYLLFFISLFLTNDFFLAYRIFLYLVAPLALVPLELERPLNLNPLRAPKFIFSFTNLKLTFFPSQSPIFLLASIFGGLVLVSSLFTPSFSFTWLWVLSSYFIAIALFMLITARLMLFYANFCEVFFFILSILAAINAAINLYDYFGSLADVSRFAEFRFAPDFGRAPDHFPTTAALTYATCFVGAGGVLFIEAAAFRKVICFFCMLIFFVALCLSQSRGPLFGALIAIILASLAAAGRQKRLALFLPVAAGGAFLLIPKIGAFAIERMDNFRFDVWRRFVILGLERPVLGFGERIEFLVEIENSQKLGHAHNIFISALMRGGVGAFFMLLAAYVLSAIRALAFARAFRNPIPLGLIILTILAGLVDFDLLVFLADWQWVSFWFPLGLSIAADMQMRVRPYPLF